MTAQPKTVTVTIARVERLGCSVYGNPYFRLHTVEGDTYRTQIDAGLNYGITNRDMIGVPVTLHLTRAGRVWKTEKTA